MTNSLIPPPGVHVVETFHPKGYSVGTYDAKGFLGADRRWFSSLEPAQTYAEQLTATSCRT